MIRLGITRCQGSLGPPPLAVVIVHAFDSTNSRSSRDSESRPFNPQADISILSHQCIERVSSLVRRQVETARFLSRRYAVRVPTRSIVGGKFWHVSNEVCKGPGFRRSLVCHAGTDDTAYLFVLEVNNSTPKRLRRKIYTLVVLTTSNDGKLEKLSSPHVLLEGRPRQPSHVERRLPLPSVDYTKR